MAEILKKGEKVKDLAANGVEKKKSRADWFHEFNSSLRSDIVWTVIVQRYIITILF